ncbi:MAG: ATP-dependent DNA helicase RecG [Cytophagales bacterium]|nr:ATP-dependent DNA helicase RecG [Cytophagales bacterium]
MEINSTQAEFLRREIKSFPGIGKRKLSVLDSELGIRYVRDLLKHYPFRYEDRTQFYLIKDLREHISSSVQLVGHLHQVQKRWVRTKDSLSAEFSDETGKISLQWWNQINWISKYLKEGRRYLIYGKPNYYKGKISIVHPEMTELKDHASPKGKIYPVYSSTQTMKRVGLSSSGLQKIIQSFLSEIHPEFETLPASLGEKYHFSQHGKALHDIHNPPNIAALNKARERLKFEEVFFMQISLLSLRRVRKENLKAHGLGMNPMVSDFLDKSLPFSLTDAQKRVINEIYSDMKSEQQMHRLLQGDVGSGKTIVAFISLLAAIGLGKQAAMMAPTEILAEQHFEVCSHWAKSLPISLSILTSSVPARERKQRWKEIKEGNIQLIIGTHALLEDNIQFHDLAVVVIDEQHRFGVWQRAKLWKKGKDKHPHVLLMTATPIPRTLSMTLYGDVDISTLDELPAGRPPLYTAHRRESARQKVESFVQTQLEQGHQAYWIYPLIEESESLDLQTIEDGFAAAQTRFPHLKIAMLHGKLPSEEKQDIMRLFIAGEIQLLISTTVIEVGIDNPRATLMIIEHANRFGLAQLHQLRGRVGRGKEKSYCILMTSSPLSEEAQKRIDTLVSHQDGFSISQVDLELRGPGDRLGTQQSGAPELKLVDLVKDQAILIAARQEAMDIIHQDPEIKDPKYQTLKEHVHALTKQAAWKYIA